MASSHDGSRNSPANVEGDIVVIQPSAGTEPATNLAPQQDMNCKAHDESHDESSSWELVDSQQDTTIDSEEAECSDRISDGSSCERSHSEEDPAATAKNVQLNYHKHKHFRKFIFKEKGTHFHIHNAKQKNVTHVHHHHHLTVKHIHIYHMHPSSTSSTVRTRKPRQPLENL